MWKRLGGQVREYWGRFREWAKENPLGLIASIILTALLLVVIYWAIWADASPQWTGFGTYDDEADGPRARTLWEWMGLLLVPAVIAVGGWLLNKSQRDLERERADRNREEDQKRAEQRAASEREIAQDQQQQATLESYLDRVTELGINLGQTGITNRAEAQSVIRVRTLAVLRSLSRSKIHIKGKTVAVI